MGRWEVEEGWEECVGEKGLQWLEGLGLAWAGALDELPFMLERFLETNVGRLGVFEGGLGDGLDAR